MNIIFLERVNYISATLSTIIILLSLLAIGALIFCVVDLTMSDWKDFLISLLVCTALAGSAIFIWETNKIPAYKVVIDDTVPVSYIKDKYDILEIRYPYFTVRGAEWNGTSPDAESWNDEVDSFADDSNIAEMAEED